MRKALLSGTSGVSLLELVIVMGISAVLILGILQIFSTMSSSVSTVEDKLSMIDVEKTLISLTGGKNLCAKAIQDDPSSFVFDVASFPPTSLVVPYLYVSPTDPQALLETGKSLSSRLRLTVTGIRFENFSGVGPSYLADLAVSVGGSDLARRPITVKASVATRLDENDPTKILVTGCATGAGGAMAESAQACATLGGEWIEPGGTRPPFCSFEDDDIDWY